MTTDPKMPERERMRAAQTAAVMPLIGPLLDAWESCSQQCREELPELDKQLRRINRAMESADTTDAQDPKMPETAAWIGTGHLREVCAGNDMNVYLSSERDRFTDIALVVREEALAYADALAAARVAQERERCVAWIEARKDAFCAAHGYIDPDTGFLEFGRGAHAQAKHDYVSELEEIADGLRALSTQPPETGKEPK